MGLAQCVVAGRVDDPVDSRAQRVADGRVAGGVQGDGLVDGGGPAGRQPQAQPLYGAVRLVGVRDRLPGGQPGGQSEADVGGAGAAAQPDRAGGGGADVDVGEVPAVQVPVAGDAGVGDAAVQGGLDVQVDGCGPRR